MRSADFDGDGCDELATAFSDGTVTIWRWRNGLWESVWTMPQWGSILALDAVEIDDEPGVELAFATSQKRVFIVGYSSGAYAVRSSFTAQVVASRLALVPGGGGRVLIGDAAGNLHLLSPESSGGWKETYLAGTGRISFLTGLDKAKVLMGMADGQLKVVRVIPLDDLAVFYDGKQVFKTGLYWHDREFYLPLPLLERILDVTSVWDDDNARLSLRGNGLQVVMEAGKSTIMVNEMAWPLSKVLVVRDGDPYVPAELLRAVFLINLTFDPWFDRLILTSASPKGL